MTTSHSDLALHIPPRTAAGRDVPESCIGTQDRFDELMGDCDRDEGYPSPQRYRFAGYASVAPGNPGRMPPVGGDAGTGVGARGSAD